MARPKKRQMRKVYINYSRELNRDYHHEMERFMMNYPKRARVRLFRQVKSQQLFDSFDHAKMKSMIRQDALENKRAGKGFNNPEYRCRLFQLKSWRLVK